MFTIKKFTTVIEYNLDQKKYLDELKPYQGGEWDDGSNIMKDIKTYIRTKLDAYQEGCCAYCGLNYRVISGSEIEHIAPKGGKKRQFHPQFAFTPLNLVLACHYCNSKGQKGEKETIVSLNLDYEKCAFNIVHPYLDEPSEHYEWAAENIKIIIRYKTEKGKFSVDLFKLDDEAHNTARAKEYLYEQLKIDNPEQLNAVLSYKCK